MAGVPDQAQPHARAEGVVFGFDACASGCSPGECSYTAAAAWSMEVNLLGFSIESNEQVAAGKHFQSRKTKSVFGIKIINGSAY
ncbi:hypothetical protein D3C79_779720 [compost metagenome]